MLQVTLGKLFTASSCRVILPSDCFPGDVWGGSAGPGVESNTTRKVVEAPGAVPGSSCGFSSSGGHVCDVPHFSFPRPRTESYHWTTIAL